MLYRLIKFVLYLAVFGTIFYLIRLYDSSLIIYWGAYEVEISTFFLLIVLLLCTVFLIKLTNLIAWVLGFPSCIKGFLNRKLDVHNIKALVEGYSLLAEGNIDQAKKIEQQLQKSTKKDKLFAPYRDDYERFKKLCKIHTIS